MLVGKLMLIGTVIVVLLVGINFLANSVVIGPAAIIDAGHLKVGEKRVKLAGLAAMPATQSCSFAGRDWPCGAAAAAALKKAIADRTVTCRPVDAPQGDEKLARCFVGSNIDLGRRMVVEGWAVADPMRDVNYSSDEQAARSKLTGVWASIFDAPTRVNHAGKDKAP